MSGYKATDPPSLLSSHLPSLEGSLHTKVGGRTALTLCSQAFRVKKKGPPLFPAAPPLQVLPAWAV